MYYILKNRDIVKVDTVLEWAQYFQRKDRTVAQENIHGFFVSTVFLGLNHSYNDKNPPLLFETMLFYKGDEFNTLDYYQTRCSTYTQAEAMHLEAVQTIRRQVLPPRVNHVLKAGIFTIVTILLIYLVL